MRLDLPDDLGIQGFSGLDDVIADWPGCRFGERPPVDVSMDAPARVATLGLVGSYGLDAKPPVPLLPYLVMRTPSLSSGVTWKLRRNRAPTRLVLATIIFSDPRLVTLDLVDAVHEQLAAPDAVGSFVAWLHGELRPFGLGT